MLVPERFRGLYTGYRTGFFAAPQAQAMGAGTELWVRRKDGSEVTVEIGLSPIETDEGLLVLTSILDISARKQAETALGRERKFLRQVIDTAPTFIFAKDRDGRFHIGKQSGS